MDPVYLCLDCARDYMNEISDLTGVSVEGIPNDRIYICGDCGLTLPESKKRELKAQNLVLRAKLAQVTHSAYEAENVWIEFLEQTRDIADNAIALAYSLWIGREIVTDLHDKAMTELIGARFRASRAI